MFHFSLSCARGKERERERERETERERKKGRERVVFLRSYRRVNVFTRSRSAWLCGRAPLFRFWLRARPEERTREIASRADPSAILGRIEGEGKRERKRERKRETRFFPRHPELSSSVIRDVRRLCRNYAMTLWRGITNRSRTLAWSTLAVDAHTHTQTHTHIHIRTGAYTRVTSIWGLPDLGVVVRNGNKGLRSFIYWRLTRTSPSGGHHF